MLGSKYKFKSSRLCRKEYIEFLKILDAKYCLSAMKKPPRFYDAFRLRYRNTKRQITTEVSEPHAVAIPIGNRVSGNQSEVR